MWLLVLSFARKHWQLLAEIALAVVAVLLIWHGIAGHFKAKYEPLIAKANAERAQAQADLAAERVNFQKAQAASRTLQDELAKLRANADAHPAPRVRCTVTSASVPETTAPGGRDGSAPGTGALPQELGQDIGPALYGNADEADRTLAQARACQAWAKSVSQ